MVEIGGRPRRRAVPRPLIAWCAVAVLASCGSGDEAATRTSSVGTPSPAASTSAPTTAAPTTTRAAGPVIGSSGPETWLTFDGGNDRRGLVAAGPDPSAIATHWTSPELDGIVYGQALVGGGSVYVATEGNSVVALSTADGSVRWSTNLGQPVPRSSLPCGNIDPTGITGTPVIDADGATIYVVDFVMPGRHELVALSTTDGAVRWRHPIDPPGLSPLVEQQRSALSLANGKVYVPFGGLFGDCGPYKGAVVSLAADGSGDTASWIVPTEREGGLWAPSGLSIDANGNLFAATGNAASTDAAAFDYGNAVVRLDPNLVLVDYWAPQDWPALSATDQDLGSQGPVPIDGTRLFVAGKAGVGYVLSSADLGEIGGQISQLQLCDSAFGGAATNGTTVVVGCRQGVVAASVGADGNLTATWQVDSARTGAPVIAGAVAWVTSMDGHARAIELASGAVLADVQTASSLQGFPETTVTSTAVYVTGSDTVTALGA
ncbi:MAG: hypothetical protein JWM12_495 [Ilumatobacteraceae bacterium]|nr:hypothetical protein [Ilumatobacteraceae bacterium]